MNGYSKMKIIDTTNSRSMDFSDLLSLSQTQNSTSKTTQNPITKLQDSYDQIKKPPTEDSFQDHHLEEEKEADEDHHQECNVGDKFGGVNKLSRTSSVSVSSASAVHSALKRALSMTRSSSVSERYCRIHDQSVTLASPIDDEDGVEMERTRSVMMMKKKHSKSKILKACKKLFGL